MTPLYRFVYPDTKWKKIAGWGRILSSGTTVGLLIGANPRAWCLGFQWWECGFCIHVGPLNIGYGWLEEVEEQSVLTRSPRHPPAGRCADA